MLFHRISGEPIQGCHKNPLIDVGITSISEVVPSGPLVLVLLKALPLLSSSMSPSYYSFHFIRSCPVAGDSVQPSNPK